LFFCNYHVGSRVWWSFYRSKKKKWLARAQQVVGVCALRTESVVPPMVVGRLQGRHPKWRATLYTVGWRMSTARPQRSLGVSKKTEKPIKPRKPKKNTKKPNRKKKPIKPIKILKKPAGSIRFRFYKQKTEKTEQNPNRKKTEPNQKNLSQNRENRAKPVWTGFCPKKPNRTETGWFDPVSVFLKKNRFGYFFFIKTEPNRKWSLLAKL